MTDMINHPPHYTGHPSGVECIQITRHMGFNLGNAFKYIWRCDLKGGSIEDLRKAAWYIADEIAKREAASNTPNEGLPFDVVKAQRDAALAEFDWGKPVGQEFDTDPQPLEWPAAPASAPPDGLDDVSAPHAAKSAEGTPAARVCGGCRHGADIAKGNLLMCQKFGEYVLADVTCPNWQPRSDLGSLAARDATAWRAQDSGVE